MKEFPHPAAANGNQEMSLSYVSAYVFGIGLAISLPCIAVALSIDECNTVIGNLREKWWPRKERLQRNEDDDEMKTLPVEHTLSIAKSLRRSVDIDWESNQRRALPRTSADISWGGGAYSRRRSSKQEWDVERGRNVARG